MAKIYTFFLCILLAQAAKCQVFDSLIHDIKENCYSENKLTEIFARYRQKEKGLSIMEVWFLYPSLFDRRVKYEISYQSRSRPWMGLTFLYKNDKVAYLSLIKTDYDSIEAENTTDTVFIYLDTTYSKRILKEINTDKRIQFTYKDLYGYEYDYFGPYGSMIFGPTRQLTGIFTSIMQKDSLSILKKAMSIYAEEAALGAIGLYIWDKEVNPLDNNAGILLNSLQSSSRIIISQYGCLIDRSKLSIDIGNQSMTEAYQEYLNWRKSK